MAGVRPTVFNLDDVKSFDKKKLKPTETTVTNPDGTCIVEGKTSTGKASKKLSESRYGFVVDTALDLQVVEVADCLLMGESFIFLLHIKIQ